MTTFKSIGFGILLALFALPLQAHEYAGNGIHIDHPWAMPTPPVKPINSAVYLMVENHRDGDLRLIGASSPISQDVSIHRSQMDNGMMSMKALPEGIVIKAGETAMFKPGGLHIMLRDLEQPLKDGDRFPIKLSFDGGEVVELEVYVEQGAEEVMEEHSH